MFDFLDAPPPPQPAAQADTLLHGLNPPQAAAVTTTEGPLLVLAGAGTGKTNVLTRRIAYLLLTHAAQPNEILAVTFTNKAAKEMAERTEKLVGTSTAGMWLGTFHRLGVRFLRQHAEAAGLQRDFTILDADDQQRLLGQLLKDENLDTQQFPPRLVANLISKYKDNGWLPNQLPRDESQALGNRAAQLYASYQQRLNSLNAVDFGDLLLLPLHVLRTQPAILAYYQTRLKYILVDEYQDTNGVQYEWLKMLAAQHKNLCVVGDDDQSIYGWRGAQVGNILNFETDFPGATVIRLEQNYRSTGHILAAANAVIANNQQRHGKNLWTDAGNGNLVEVHPLLDDREEARFVADESQRHIRSNGNLNDIAVLVRTSSQTRAFEEQFIRAGLPYTLIGGLKFYERKEVKDALAYLRIIASARDDLAFQRIVNVPRRGIGETTMGQIEDLARRDAIPLTAAAASLIRDNEISGRAAQQLNLLLEQIEQWRYTSQQQTPDRLAERMLEESGYAEMLRTDKEDDAKTRIDNLKELLRALQDYADIPSFLEHVALVSEADTQDTESLKLMTIHAAKGLEFPLVFLPGFEEGLFPHQRAMNEEGQKGLEEERRLAYVAITRARSRCVISFAAARRMWGQFLPGQPSRFLMEIPEQHLKRVAPTFGAAASFGQPQPYKPVHGFVPSRPAVGSTSDKRGNWSGNDSPSKAEPLIPYTTPAQPGTNNYQLSTNNYSVGQKVHHAKFGPGEIKAIEGTGEATKLTIAFKHAGTKKLLASLAKLN